MAALLSRRGATVWRCPLVGIVDAPDPKPIVEFLCDFIDSPPDVFVVLTGEGLRRLRGFAQQAGLSEQELRQALLSTHILSRGPKPARELRRMNLAPVGLAAAPTTEGVIATLDEMTIAGQRIAVQLYGDNPNVRLIDYLRSREAQVTTVAPYRYAKDISREQIGRLIHDLDARVLNAIVFTSRPQVLRLFAEGKALGAEAALRHGLKNCVVAAVGPVVAQCLRENACRVDVMPDDRYFMKPLVQALVERHQKSCVVAAAQCGRD